MAEKKNQQPKLYQSFVFNNTNGSVQNTNKATGNYSISEVEISQSSPSCSRRFGTLSAVPEKEEVTPQGTLVHSIGQVFKKTIRAPQLIGKDAQSKNINMETVSRTGLKACHLSPKTLRRLEHKHQLAKLQQSLQLGSSPANSPPMSPQTARRIFIVKGGAQNRRFTVARTR